MNTTDNLENLTLRKTLARFRKDWKTYRSYVFYTAWSELRSETAGTYLAWIWWILEPFCLMIVYTIVFGLIFRLREPNFPVFVMCGISMWRFFSMSLSGSAQLIKSHKSIISHVYVPKQMLLLILLFRTGFKSLFSFLVVLIMMIFYGIVPGLTALLILPSFLLLFIVTYFTCCFVMHLGVFIQDMSYIVNVATTLLMYFTGTFWSIETRVPAPYGLLLARVNPIAFSISLTRNGLLYGVNSFHWSYFIWIALGLLLSAVGTRLIYKNENTYVKVI